MIFQLLLPNVYPKNCVIANPKIRLHFPVRPPKIKLAKVVRNYQNVTFNCEAIHDN